MGGILSLVFLVLAIAAAVCWYLEVNEYDAPFVIKIAGWPAVIILSIYCLRTVGLTWQLRSLPAESIPSYLTAFLIASGFLAVYRQPLFELVDNAMYQGRKP